MKTPRELLLAKHGAEIPVLDALRCAALPEPRVGIGAFLLLIFFPQRRLWGALALVWVAVLVLALADDRRPRAPQSAASHEAIAEWTANRNKLHDLFAETGTRR